MRHLCVFVGMVTLPLWAANAATSLTQETLKLVSSYQSCLSAESLALEKSGADFDDIFEAADTACSPEWAAALKAAEKDMELKPAPGVTELPIDRASGLLDRMKSSWKPPIRLAVLRQRAERNSR
jgi:hypothetical protein